MKIISILYDKVINYIFKVSKQPVLYRDLLQANALFNEGMYVDPSKLNFKTNFKRSYLIYALICFCIIAPLLLISHFIFLKVNFHFSVIGAIIGTSCVFIGFDFFKLKTRKTITKRLIKKAWENHFPYFPYDKYSKKVEDLYNQALKEDVPKNNFEIYILEGLSSQK